MIDLMNNTFVIPFFHDSDIRYENLNHVLKWLNTHFNTNVILGEQHSKKILELEKFENFSRQYVTIPSVEYEGQKLFHMTKLVNEMAKRVTTPFLTILGSDNMVHPHQILKAFEILELGIAKVVYPFSKPTTDLHQEFKYLLGHYKYDISKIEKYLVNQYTSGAVGYGNCIIYDRHTFLDVGGYNNEFKSWGSEDREIFHRCFQVGVPMARVEGFVCHLSHPRFVNSGDGNPFRVRNNDLATQVQNMNGLETLKYIKESKERGNMI